MRRVITEGEKTATRENIRALFVRGFSLAPRPLPPAPNRPRSTIANGSLAVRHG